MGQDAAEIEFRNREQELVHILQRLPPQCCKSSITFVRAPPGYGKTRLVDQVLATFDPGQIQFTVVEPEIRARSDSNRVYSWYFVQRAAAAIAPDMPKRPTFKNFIRERGISKINWRGFYETAKESYSISKLIKLGIDICENLLGKNRYHPESLLKDESTYATTLAREYVEAVARIGVFLFVVREAHLIDHESFRFFLTLHKTCEQIFFIFEYTAAQEFQPEHQKIVEESRSSNSQMRIVDLLRLGEKELLYLLKKYVRDDIETSSAEFARWNGNLRLVRELKDQVYVERPLTTGTQLHVLETNLQVLIHDRILGLGNVAKFCLAATACHVEALPEVILVLAASKVDTAGLKSARRVVVELIHGTKYLSLERGRLLISDEDVASVVLDSPSFARYRALAQRSLREIYLCVLDGDRDVSVPLPLAFREAIALCLATGDSLASTRLLRTLAREGRRAHDQTMYVSLVADALLRRTGRVVSATIELIDWAASTAYEIGDYRTCAGLLEELPERDSFHDSFLGFCYCELNRHQEGISIGRELYVNVDTPDPLDILGRLILISNLFALGRKSEAKDIHSQLRYDDRLTGMALYGYVLRFTEILYNFPDCTPDVLLSIEHFRRHDLHASSAYSALSGAMHLAYQGEIVRARSLFSEARHFLSGEFRDLHILLNNEAVIGLFAAQADFEACAALLDRASYSVRDDFYRAVIENNRLICHWMLGKTQDALRCVESLEGIMKNPGFGNRDVFWTFSYNCWAFLLEKHDEHRADKILDLLAEVKVEELDYEEYWRFRFGKGERPPSKYDNLLQYKYHPEYLSHWLVDVDAIRVSRVVQHQ